MLGTVQTTFGPTVPGITTPPLGSDGPMPSILKALKETDPKAKASALMDVSRKWYEYHRWYYREATECEAFYAGSQWGMWSDVLSRWVARPEPRHNATTRITINGVKPVTDMAVALMTQESPIFGCAAAKDEARDSAASDVGDAVLDYTWRQHRLVETYRNSARDAFTTGTAPVLVEWDPDAGRVSPRMGPDGKPEFEVVDDPEAPLGIAFQTKKAALGDLRFTLLPRESVAFEPGSQNDQGGVALLVKDRMLRSELRERFPDKFAETTEGGTSDADEYQRLGRIIDRSSPAGRGAASERDEVEFTDVVTAYVRKCREYPLGRMVRFTDTAILYEGDNPVYPTDAEPDEMWPRINWPVLFVKCDERTREPWGAGRVVQMLDPQRSLNGVASKTLQHIATISNTKVMVPQTATWDWSDEVGQILRLNRMTSPNGIGYLTPPQMPQEFIVAWDRFKAELEYAAGINSSTLGQSPTSDASGRLVQLLQQKDTGRIAPVKRSIDATWAEIMRYALFLFRRHADQKRKILVVGENKDIELRFFDRADLAAGTDVLVFNDQSVPRDPSQRMLWLQQFTTTLGTIPDPNVRRMVMRLARVKDFEAFLSDLDPAEAKSRRVRQAVILKVPVYLWPGDDALAMAAELDRFCSTREYERMVESEMATGQPSQTEAYASALYAYFKEVATGMRPANPAGFMPVPPPSPAAPPPMPTMPPSPMGGGAPAMPPGAPMPGEAPPPIPTAQTASTPLAPVTA